MLSTVVPGRVNSNFFCLLLLQFLKKFHLPSLVKVVKWMECIFAKAAVIMNTCSLDKKINLNSLGQKIH